MFALQTKIKRQIEVVGLALANTDCSTDADFAVQMDRDVPTIKRDLKDLRFEGIDIHSERNRGICVDRKIESKKLQTLIVQYAGLCAEDGTIDRATKLLVKKHKDKALALMVTLQRGVDRSTAVEIEYEKGADDVDRRIIHPLQIFSSEGYWRVLAVNNGTVKQFHLNKINSARATKTRFKRIPQETIAEMFQHSFKSWAGTDQFLVRLRLNPTWAERLKPQQLMETQVTRDEQDGSVTIEATVNSLEEVASWVVSKGEGVTVLEPEALKRKVVGVANGVLKNYHK